MRDLLPQRGFTLTETLTTLAIVGIGLSLALPSLSSITGNNNQAVSVNQMVATMHLARSQAITRNSRVTVCPSRSAARCENHPWEQGWIAFLDSNADRQRDTEEPLLEQVSSLTNIELSSVEFTHSFSYGANGRVMGDSPEHRSGEFSFCLPGSEEAARVLVVRANGLPALSDKRRDGSAAPCEDR